MAARPKSDDPPKRLNRTVGVGEALQKALDPVFRKRGFAGRDIITHWAAMVPTPYDKISAPDRLAWPRGERNAGGATLYLRCAEGHALALQHEAPLIAASVNRYFGYVLVDTVRLSAEPFVAQARIKAKTAPEPSPETTARLDEAVAEIADDGVRDALRRLGSGIMGRKSQ